MFTDCTISVLLLQVVDRAERVFNASSTLTPDSMMSDESQSRDWQLAAELAAGSNSADEPRFAAKQISESDVRQFSNVSAESPTRDDSVDKCERSDATDESPQLLNRCMLSGIDVSTTCCDLNVSTGSADMSTEAALNDARLSSASDSDSSVSSTLKGSDTEEPSRTEKMRQPTFSVSIPISTMFETETKKDENASVDSTGVKSSSGCDAVVREAYSPISDAGAETTTSCRTPVPSTPPVSSRSAVRPFSPISPFTPLPSAPNTPLPVVPLYWSHDVQPSSSSSAAAAACDTSAWSIDASESGRQTVQRHCDVIAPRDGDFTVKQYSSYPHHPGLSHGSLAGPMEVNTPAAGQCRNVRFQQQQHTAITLHQGYQQPESRYPDPVFPRHQYHSPYAPQPGVHYADTVNDSVLAHSLYSASNQRQVVVSAAEAGKYSTSQSINPQRATNTVNDRFAAPSHPDVGSALAAVSSVGHPLAVGNQARIDGCDDWVQICHSANTGIDNSGLCICFY